MLQRFIPLEKIDREQRMVFGYASTEALDNQGEVVRKEAIEAALPDYMTFANIREMHQPSAVGVAKEAQLDAKGLRLAAKVVDDVAWNKVTSGVYKGFSIGGRVTARDPADAHVITGIDLLEISLVDRPANPEAVIELFKAAAVDPAEAAIAALTAAVAKAEARPHQGEPDWEYRDPEAHAEAAKHHEHAAAFHEGARAKAEKDGDGKEAARHQALQEHHERRMKEHHAAAEKARGDGARKGGDLPGDGSHPYGDEDYADPGYQRDKKKRYPLTRDGKPDKERIEAAWKYIHKRKNARKYSTEDCDKIKARIIAAWKAHIDKDGPPEARRRGKAARTEDLNKGLPEVAETAHLLHALVNLRQRIVMEAAMEADDSPQPKTLAGIIGQLIEYLRADVIEETQEIMAGDGDIGVATLPEIAIIEAAARPQGLDKVIGIVGMAQPALADALRKVGARHSKADQDRVQRMHDTAVELGADCPAAGEKSATGADLAKLTATVKERDATIRRMADVMADVAERVRKIEAQPMPGGPRLRAVGREEDGGAPASQAQVDDFLERFATMSREQQALELTKLALRNPRIINAERK